MIDPMENPRILFVFGTRPEAIKCAPVVLAAQADPRLDTKVLVTSQHRELQDGIMRYFGITPDYDLDLMGSKPDLVRLVREAWTQLSGLFQRESFDMVLAQGDTTTAFIATLAAQYQKIPVAHIEAGLRTGDKFQPFPEELNRRLITHAADLHFAPTHQAKSNLLLENVDETSIRVVGNSGIDALLYALDHPDTDFEARVGALTPPGARVILATCHRRENWGGNILDICEALKNIATTNPGVVLFFLVHPNPNVKGVVEERLAGIDNIHCLPAVHYQEMAVLLKKAYLILTDSGGIQEEAPTLGKPVLVLRNRSERAEMIEQGCGLLLGTQTERIVSTTRRFLYEDEYYRSFTRATNVFGDGKASPRIVQGVKSFFGLCEPPEDLPLPNARLAEAL